ncbi:MAG: hypothetical protein KFB96_15975 [Thiocapsa sp.]|uniref:hypothetical protein n=1 Tax=Thiocapsa sp. TaxID=2024551 RepID=UPI001BCAC7FC|nr:hypothetical protein [Thiocapsa sp.]QVL47213.1 MAG: hypothetical protein KFB96_15975 [Thiocapsa sp.]
MTLLPFTITERCIPALARCGTTTTSEPRSRIASVPRMATRPDAVAVYSRTTSPKALP